MTVHSAQRFLAAAPAMAALLLMAACGDDDSAEDSEAATAGASATAAPAEITFMAGFKPQANLPFVGVYVAQELGFFAEENLTVNIQHVTNPGDNFRFLAAGEVQITTADAQVVLERRASDPPIDLVSLALIGQRGQQGFAVLADSGIASPADWAGKTAGYKGSQVTPDYLAILAANDVAREDVQEVKVGFDPRILAEGQVDIFPVFVSNEPDTLRRMGYDVKVFEAADYGAPTLGLTYVAMRDWVEENEDVAQRFVRAVLRGINYADINLEAAVDIVMKYAPQEDRDHQNYILETELDAAGGCLRRGAGSCPPGRLQPGMQTEEQWQRLHDFLVQYGALSGPLADVSLVFTSQFVDRVWEEGIPNP